jgi:hypothetical protein
MKIYGEMEIHVHHFRPLHNMKTSDQLHASAALPRRNGLAAHWIGNLVDPRAGLDSVK